VLKVIAYKIEQKPEEEVSGLEAAFLAVYQTTLEHAPEWLHASDVG